MKTIAIIQARMTSSRLPGKIIKNFSNQLNILDMQLQTLQTILNRKQIYIATTTNPEDDIIEEKYSNICNVYRGSEDDVLSRFLEITNITNAENIIRIASDNPFIFKEGIELLLQSHIDTKSDYTTFSIEGTPSMLVPSGLYVEVISSNSLLEIEKRANSTEKEHVTYALYTRLKKDYKINLLPISNLYSLLENTHLRYTIDTNEDFLFINQIIHNLFIKNVITLAMIKKIINYSQENDSIIQMKNESSKKKNSKNYNPEESQ